jgi:signal-transduction protein with cAMP-binding, CBS, and nucleotidyltransferase domain
MVLAKYKPIIMQMWADQLASEITYANITTLLDVHIFLGFHYIMPLLELLHGLIKMVQA